MLGADPTQSAIYKNPVLYILYGGFAAGIFEETARLLCFKSFIRVGNNESIYTGISYGLGHGGIEAILIGGIASVGNIVTSVMLNSGVLKGVTQQIQTFGFFATFVCNSPTREWNRHKIHSRIIRSCQPKDYPAIPTR